MSTSQPEPTQHVETPLNLVIIGVGASGGGLDALRSFFAAVPSDCQLTFVVVSHTPPDRPALLPKLLQARTKLPVTEIVHGENPDAHHVYVPPSWSQLRLADGIFLLSGFAHPRERSRRIDFFLTSLAEEMRSRSAGALLSGGGSDGTRGIELIAANGGLTLAQTPATAQQSSMPSCAISSGRVQHVVDAHQMPSVIMRHFSALGPPQQSTPRAALCADG